MRFGAILILVLCVTALVFSLLIPICVKTEISKRLDLDLKGTPQGRLFGGEFLLKDARFIWKGKMEFVSGDLTVGYRVIPWLLSKRLPLRITGKNLKIKLFDEWELKNQSNLVSIECLDSIFILNERDVDEVKRLHMQSNEFQFRLNQSENIDSYCGSTAEALS